MLTFIAGLAAGCAHVVTGPDHLAALAPIAVDRPKKAMALGARWGLGHGVGVVLLGGLGVLAKGHFDVDFASRWAEFSVGFMLIGLGIWALYRARALVIHDHDHRHHDVSPHATSAVHAHVHVHLHPSAVDHDAPKAHAAHAHAAFFVGLLHGAAGAGHLFGVLPSLALPPEQAAVYLGAYFVAAVASMAGFGAAMGMLATRTGPRMVKRLMMTSSSLAIGVGAMWIVTAFPA